MNPEIKKQWVAALRSGKYEQGRMRLKRDGRFCCLGVLCEILPTALSKPADCLMRGRVYDEQTTELSFQLLREVGLEHPDQALLMGFNDTEVKSFAEIADYIEENL